MNRRLEALVRVLVCVFAVLSILVMALSKRNDDVSATVKPITEVQKLQAEMPIEENR
jgi:hypothetical protein